MTKYLVRFQTLLDGGVWVDTDDPEDAWDEAYDHIPRICAQCTGWGSSGKFFMEMNDEHELYVVEDEDGQTLASDLTHHDYLQNEVRRLTKRIEELTKDD